MVYVKESIPAEILDINTPTPSISLKMSNMTVSFIYNEFTSNESRIPQKTRFENLYKTLDIIKRASHNAVIMGDINIHIEDENDRATKAFNDWCRNNNFKEIQQENTREDSILDVVNNFFCVSPSF